MQSNDSNIPAFPAYPCPSRYVALGAIEEGVSRVSRAIEAREAAALVIGPPGTGKSLLCGLIANQYRPTHKVVVLGEAPLDSPESMMRHLLHHLGVAAKSILDGDPYLALIDYINDPSRGDQGLIIIVDEAQKLSAELIEAIRMVTNITRQDQPYVFALLCGGVKLDETLVDASLESFTQRAATRCYLHPMNAAETRDYIHQTISSCGADPESTITDEAIAAIHHACSGVPRLINQLVTQAIDCAADADQTLITESFVDRAWSQLQQLPGPMVEEPKLSNPAATIEFGELGDSDDSPQWEDEPASYESGSDQVEIGQPVDHQAEVQIPKGDIELETSSAAWVEEPRAETDQQSWALFGEFDHEEEIPVGSGIVAAQQASVSGPTNLESLLQQEIVAAGRPIQQADSAPAMLHIHADQELAVAADDSDLLVIEDEISVLPINGETPAPSQAREVSIDFQEMLHKMRGSN